MGYFNIINKATNKVVNIKGSNVVSLTSHQNVTLFTPTASNEQIWFIETPLEGNYNVGFIRSYVDDAFGLNVNRRQGTDYYNCDLMKIAGNETDAKVEFINQGYDYYKIKLANYDAYLTATGTSDSSNIKWESLKNSDMQVWSFSWIDLDYMNHEYHIVSYSGKSDALKVGSYNRLSSDESPSLEKFSYLNRQRWHLQTAGNSRKIRSKHGDNYMLGLGGASQVIVSDSISASNSNITLIPNASCYKIKLTNHELYLTASGNSVFWCPEDEYSTLPDRQSWALNLDIDTHPGVDVYSTNGNIATINALKRGCEEFVGRYYTSVSSGKILTVKERDAIHNAGISIVSIYQDYGKEESDFNTETGQKHAKVAYDLALNLSQPANTPIYFAVDCDLGSGSETSIINYFNSIKTFFNSCSIKYKIGIYGNGYLCNLIKQEKNLADYSFLASSTAWNGYSSYDDISKYNIKQGELIYYNGTAFDDDTAIGDDYGQW